MERYLLMLFFLALLSSAPGVVCAGGNQIAVFPLQELGESLNGVNLRLTRDVAERLAEAGNEIIGMESMMAFMTMNRIRTPGSLDTVNISRLRRDLGAAFILFGTVSERKESSMARIGLILSLVRTSDMRTVWSYVDGRSKSEERNVLAIAEPKTSDELLQILFADLLRNWPWQTIRDEQHSGAVKLDSVLLRPVDVRPGGEVSCRVRLENTWGSGQAPRVFFKADEQLYPASVQPDGISYEGRWVAGEENGRVPVTLILEWPFFGRTESALLGNYLVDGTLPLFSLDLRGVRKLDDRLVFGEEVMIIPRMIVRKQLARWRLSFSFEGMDAELADMEGEGNLPRGFIWRGLGGYDDMGDGTYLIRLEAWDKAGNMYQVAEKVELRRSEPQLDLALTQSENEVVADLEYSGKVPLSYWRLEMWTDEGVILTQAEGEDLPISIDMDMPGTAQNETLRGVIFSRNILGKQSRQDVADFLPKLSDQKQHEAEDDGSVSESWVDEF